MACCSAMPTPKPWSRKCAVNPAMPWTREDCIWLGLRKTRRYPDSDARSFTAGKPGYGLGAHLPMIIPGFQQTGQSHQNELGIVGQVGQLQLMQRANPIQRFRDAGYFL